MANDMMNRSVTQALYKYLPGTWGDFYLSNTWANYTMLVDSWNSIKLDDINGQRLLKEIEYNLQSFLRHEGKTVGFGKKITLNTFDILTPKCNEGSFPDIISYLSPLTFFCSKCKKIKYYQNSREYLRDIRNRNCSCGGNLEQIQLIYACECGWAGPVRPLKCKKHGTTNLKYIPNKYSYLCTKDGSLIDMVEYCPECQTRLYPRNALDQANFIPFSLQIIDFLNPEEERFIVEEPLAPKIVLGNWLGIIQEEEYESLMENKNLGEMDVTKSKKYKKLYNLYIDNGMFETQARDLAKASCDELNATNEVKTVTDFVDKNVDRYSEEFYMKKMASSFLEYKNIEEAEIVIRVEKARDIALELNTIVDPLVYEKTSKKYGISKIQASGQVPLINCSYGFTRRESDPKQFFKKNNRKLAIKSFKQEGNKKNVYATKLKTEGLLIELDKKKVIKWMIKNKFLDNNIAPDINNDRELKLWFLNNIDLNAIHSFLDIDIEEAPYTYHIYNLIHSMSHAIMREAGNISGLDKNSLAEYLFPNIPAIFIYCQNSQGITLGSLFNLFSTHYDKWLLQSEEAMSKCVFDPICLDRDKACMGCLYINEISCVHFNKDLNRRYLVGYYDYENNSRTYGYWEDF
ncbi:MAG: hypothetical protein ACOCRK_01850 [bacterium]